MKTAVLLGSMAHTFCCCRPIGNLFGVGFFSRPRKPHRPQRSATMSSPTARPTATPGWVGQCSNTSRWSVSSASVSGQGYGGHGGHDDGLQALPRRGLKSRILHHSTNQGSDRATINWSYIIMIMIYLFIWSDSFLIIFRLICLVGWMIFPPFSWISYAWNSISCRITVYTQQTDDEVDDWGETRYPIYRLRAKWTTIYSPWFYSLSRIVYGLYCNRDSIVCHCFPYFFFFFSFSLITLVEQSILLSHLNNQIDIVKSVL